MPVQVIQVKVRPDSVAEMEAGIRSLVGALKEQGPEGVRYAYGKLADGVTFLAVLELADGVDNPLLALPEAQEYVANLKGWIDQDTPPMPEPLEVIGSYNLFTHEA
jgi:hypothetical protein